MYYLGIDLGGTNIAVGIVDEENKIIARANSKTQTENAEQVADAMAETARKALESAGLTLADVPWIGVGSPGTINKSTGIIEFANNLPFKNTPMQEMLSQRLEGKQVLMENDANAAAFGEYMAGALKGSDNAIAITLGTGVGGGISNEGETLLAPVREYVEKEQYAMNSTKKTTICRAKLGNDAGIIGAALLGKMED